MPETSPARDVKGTIADSPSMTRRALLAGTASVAGAVVLDACSGGSSLSSSPTSSPSAGARSLVAIFDRDKSFTRAGVPQRLAFAIAGPDGVPGQDAPASLDFRLTLGGAPVGQPITVERHHDGVPIPYFPLRFTPERPGTFNAIATIDGKDVTAAFMVGAATDVRIPQVGEKLVRIDTPTTSDNLGVTPICTRKPDACGLHSENLTDAMQSGRPIALLVSTPAFCQIGVCGPVLELLLEESAKRPGIAMLHAEVYKDTSSGDIRSAEPAPVMAAYNLQYEPVLFVATPDGTIVDRLDNVFDRAEIKSALDKASA